MQAGRLMHELGHTLLRHGGADGINCKPNYLSVMSYSRQFDGNPIWGRPLDYSAEALPRSDETRLDEPAGISGPAGVITAYGPETAKAGSGGAIDWNRDGDSTYLNVNTHDVNSFPSIGCSGEGTEFAGHDDWSKLLYDFRHSLDFADGTRLSVLGSEEMTLTQATALRQQEVAIAIQPAAIKLSAHGQINLAILTRSSN